MEGGSREGLQCCDFPQPGRSSERTVGQVRRRDAAPESGGVLFPQTRAGAAGNAQPRRCCLFWRRSVLLGRATPRGLFALASPRCDFYELPKCRNTQSRWSRSRAPHHQNQHHSWGGGAHSSHHHKYPQRFQLQADFSGFSRTEDPVLWMVDEVLQRLAAGQAPGGLLRSGFPSMRGTR